MREYETAFIVQPEISDEGSLAIRGKLDGVLESQGATRLMCEDLGKRKLAYEIRRFQKGHYYILSYLDEGAVIPELERTLRLEESVLRFMTVQISERVADADARVSEAREAELAQEKRAEERVARELEEARIRAEAAAARESEEAARAASQEASSESDEATSQAGDADEAAAEETAPAAGAATEEAPAEGSAEVAAEEEQEEASKEEPST